MKLNKTTEWTLIAVLAAYIAFMPRIGVVRDFLSSGVGRLVALLLIVYTWKYVNALVAVLLVVAFVRCTTSVWEGLEVGTESTDPPEIQGKAKSATCPTKTSFDVGTQMCKSEDGRAMVLPMNVQCMAGYEANAAGTRCVKIVTDPAPPPPTPELPDAASTGSKTANNAGQAKPKEGFIPGKGTIATTPGEAQTQAAGTVVLQQQGGAEPFTGLGTGYPLQ